MKTKNVAAFIVAAIVAGVAVAVSIPQAPVVTYGLVRDEFGTPLGADAGAVMTLVKDADQAGTVYSKTVAGPTAYPGVNYRLSLEIDSEGPSRSYAVVRGTPMRVKCTIDGAVRNLTPSPVFATPVNGTAQRLDFSLGDDADGDGLPDAWEAWMLQLAGRAHDADAIAAFRPGDDADGDGMTNAAEYFAGTNPFLATDLLAITSFEKVAESGGTRRMMIKFTTVPGREYRIVTAEKLNASLWAPAATTRIADGTPAFETYQGTGRQITVYLDVDSRAAAFFKVAAN
jgi:hypothetical protein